MADDITFDNQGKGLKIGYEGFFFWKYGRNPCFLLQRSLIGIIQDILIKRNIRTYLNFMVEILFDKGRFFVFMNY